MDLQLKIEGGIYGLLLGNAMGTVKRSIPGQRISYADAGAMSLCTMASLIDMEQVDADDIMHRFHEWYIGDYLASESHTEPRIAVSQAIRQFGNGMPPDKCGSRDREFCDNSALMRMLPIAIWHAGDGIELIEQAHAATLYTNTQIEAQVCSALYCMAIQSLMLNTSRQGRPIPNKLNDCYEELELGEHLAELDNVRKQYAQGKGTSQVSDSFWTCWDCFSKVQNGTTPLYEEATNNALKIGKDKEVICGITGSLSGTLNGINSIPENQLRTLKLPKEAERIIESFIQAALIRFVRKNQRKDSLDIRI